MRWLLLVAAWQATAGGDNERAFGQAEGYMVDLTAPALDARAREDYGAAAVLKEQLEAYPASSSPLGAPGASELNVLDTAVTDLTALDNLQIQLEREEAAATAGAEQKSETTAGAAPAPAPAPVPAPAATACVPAPSFTDRGLGFFFSRTVKSGDTICAVEASPGGGPPRTARTAVYKTQYCDSPDSGIRAKWLAPHIFPRQPTRLIDLAEVSVGAGGAWFWNGAPFPGGAPDVLIGRRTPVEHAR